MKRRNTFQKCYEICYEFIWCFHKPSSSRHNVWGDTWPLLCVWKSVFTMAMAGFLSGEAVSFLYPFSLISHTLLEGCT
jgi:hypothetical protein